MSSLIDEFLDLKLWLLLAGANAIRRASALWRRAASASDGFVDDGAAAVAGKGGAKGRGVGGRRLVLVFLFSQCGNPFVAHQ